MSEDAGHHADAPPAASIARAANMLSSEVGEDGTIEIFELFLRDARSRAEDTARAQKAGNADELRRAAHSFASVCRTVGAEDFASILEGVERCAMMGSFAMAEKLMARAFDELPGVLALVEVEVERLRKLIS
jgi:histidine phosphotransfer protein HptB